MNRRQRVLDATMAVVLVLAVVRIALALPGRWLESDFNHYYLSSRLLLEGHNPYAMPATDLTGGDADRQALVATVLNLRREDFGGRPLGNTVTVAGYPPVFLWFFAALAWLPARVAFGLWVVGQALCLAGTLWLTRRLVAASWPGRWWWFFVVGVLAAEGVFWHFFFSQTQCLMAVLLLGALAAHRRGREGWAVTLVVVAGMLKLYPFALLPWFVWRSRRPGRTLVIAGLAAAALVVTSGVEWWWKYVERGLAVAGSGVAYRTFNVGVPSLIANVAGVTWAPLGLAVGVGLIGLAYWRCRAGGLSALAQFGLLTVAVLVGGATTWRHYLVLAIFPVAIWVGQVVARPSRREVGWLLLAVCALNDFWGLVPAGWRVWWPAKFALAYAPTWGLLGVGWRLWRKEPA